MGINTLPRVVTPSEWFLLPSQFEFTMKGKKKKLHGEEIHSIYNGPFFWRGLLPRKAKVHLGACLTAGSGVGG